MIISEKIFFAITRLFKSTVMDIDSDVSDPCFFNPTEWIGVGKRHKDTLFVLAEKLQLYPLVLKTHCLGRIDQLQLNDFNIFPMRAWFSQIEVFEHMTGLIFRTFPSMTAHSMSYIQCNFMSTVSDIRDGHSDKFGRNFVRTKMTRFPEESIRPPQ